MSNDISSKPISFIKEMFESHFGPDWTMLEEETISLDLGIIMDDVLLQKIRFLKVMEEDPGRFYEDPIFFLHSCDILNNVPVQAGHIPMPTSLEIAYGLEEVSKLYPHEEHITDELKKTVTYILQQEGFSHAPYPFNFVDPAALSPGDTEEEMNNKARAINTYIKHMSEA